MSNNENGSSNNGQNSRRDFLKIGGLTLSGAFIGSKLLSTPSTALASGGAPVMVKTTDPMAQALGYIEDAKKVDTKKWPKRAGAAGAKQFCYNCQFYIEPNNPKASKSAPCTILANKHVAGQGWCNTWTQNPKVKD